MRHHNRNKKFGRSKNQRKALMKSLAISLINYNRITTTETKAKSLRPYVEKLITQAKKQNLGVSDQRLIISRIGNKEITKKLIENIASKYADRKGGYTRIIKMQPRMSDGAKMALIEFV
jgi:large subunit ribosomal protein L17